tara:strand:+ start:2811 stop:2993 length:183 start_codon:yes stop_codon:yes gene_type:complete
MVVEVEEALPLGEAMIVVVSEGLLASEVSVGHAQNIEEFECFEMQGERVAMGIGALFVVK